MKIFGLTLTLKIIAELTISVNRLVRFIIVWCQFIVALWYFVNYCTFTVSYLLFVLAKMHKYILIKNNRRKNTNHFCSLCLFSQLARLQLMCAFRNIQKRVDISIYRPVIPSHFCFIFDTDNSKSAAVIHSDKWESFELFITCFFFPRL